jgi:hypothetical protein
VPLQPDALRVVLTYRDQTAALQARIVRYIETTWGRMGSWRDQDIDRFVSLVLPIVEGGQRTIAALTDAYLAAVLGRMTGSTVAPVGINPRTVTSSALRGVEGRDLFHRVGVTVWTALSEGDSLPLATDKGLQRALSLATTNLQLAKTHTSRWVLETHDDVVGYRRVLEGPTSCGLCAVASTQRYRQGELMPIHGGCDCGVAPIVGDTDPGRVIDPDGLAGIREQLSDRFGVTGDRINRADDLRSRVVVNEHGEIGPVLGVRGQNFTGPDDF